MFCYAASASVFQLCVDLTLIFRRSERMNVGGPRLDSAASKGRELSANGSVNAFAARHYWRSKKRLRMMAGATPLPGPLQASARHADISERSRYFLRHAVVMVNRRRLRPLRIAVLSGTKLIFVKVLVGLNCHTTQRLRHVRSCTR